MKPIKLGAGAEEKPFRAEFPFSIGRHEGRREAKGTQTETALRAAAHVVHDSHRSLIEFFLVMVLVFDHVEVDKVAQIRTGVPPDIVGVDINLTEFLDHFYLICAVGLGPWGCRSQVRRRVLVVMMAVGGGSFNGRKRERVRDL